jgi:hypothetical protein
MPDCSHGSGDIGKALGTCRTARHRGECYVTRQRELVAELERGGHDTNEARRLCTSSSNCLRSSLPIVTGCAKRDRLMRSARTFNHGAIACAAIPPITTTTIATKARTSGRPPARSVQQRTLVLAALFGRVANSSRRQRGPIEVTLVRRANAPQITRTTIAPTTAPIRPAPSSAR